jgi:hypothetical protein
MLSFDIELRSISQRLLIRHANYATKARQPSELPHHKENEPWDLLKMV